VKIVLTSSCIEMYLPFGLTNKLERKIQTLKSFNLKCNIWKSSDLGTQDDLRRLFQSPENSLNDWIEKITAGVFVYV